MQRRVLIGAPLAAAIAVLALVFFANQRSHASHPKERIEKESPQVHRVTPTRAPMKIEDRAAAKLAGRVVDRQGAAIAQAKVCATKVLFTACADTDARGRYTIAGLEAGRWEAGASKRAYLAARPEPGGAVEEIELLPGATATADFVLTLGGAELSGVVRDSGGGVIAGAIVEDDHHTRAESDGEGHFALWLTPGAATLTARAEGYASEIADATAPGTIDIVLHPESTISGRVIAAGSGAPIAGATVTTEWAGGDLSAASDEHGTFKIAGVAPGEHHLSAIAPGWRARPGEVIVVGRADTVEDVVLEVSPALTIRGSVLETPAKTPCAGATVTVYEDDGEFFRIVDADETGHFEVYGLLPEVHLLSAHCELGDVGATVEVELFDEDAEVEIEVAESAARLRGIVLGRDGEPRGNTELALEHKKTGSMVAINTGPDGRFLVLLPELGTWSVVGERDCPEEKALLSIEVLVPDPPPETISLAVFGGIRGRVIDRDGTPIAAALVFLPADGLSSGCVGPVAASSQSDGRFEIDLAPDRWTVETLDADDDEEEQEEIHHGADVVEVIEVRAGVTEEIEIVLEPQRGWIAGIVVDKDGHPVRDAMVSYAPLTEDDEDGEPSEGLVWDDLDFEYDFEVTDENGRFRIDGLAEGLYGVGAEARQGGAGKVSRVQTGSEVTIALEAWASIEGVVLLPSGEPATSYSLTASIGDDARTIEVWNARGRFTLRVPGSGSGALLAESDDGEANVEVELHPGESKRGVELRLEPYGDEPEPE